MEDKLPTHRKELDDANFNSGEELWFSRYLTRNIHLIKYFWMSMKVSFSFRVFSNVKTILIFMYALS